MRATLEYQLPEETEEFDLACKAGAIHSALCSVSMELRRLYKYNDGASEDTRAAYEHARRILLTTLQDEAGVDI